jgi:hypothetical protein
MNSIKTTLTAFLLLSLTTLNGAFSAPKYRIDSNNSVVNFSTIKKQYVVEPAVFEGITGSISSSGKAEIGTIIRNPLFTHLAISLNPALALLGQGLKKSPIEQKLDFANHPYLCKGLSISTGSH